MTLVLELRCREEDCKRSQLLRPWFTLTKCGVLRVEGGAGQWIVDGNGATCPDHVTDKQIRSSAQRETWTDYDRRSVALQEEDQ